MNNITISGRLVRDFDTYTFDDGNCIYHSTLAVQMSKERCIFIEIQANSSSAQNLLKKIGWCKKGDLIGVEGYLDSRDTKDGNKVFQIKMRNLDKFRSVEQNPNNASGINYQSTQLDEPNEYPMADIIDEEDYAF